MTITISFTDPSDGFTYNDTFTNWNDVFEKTPLYKEIIHPDFMNVKNLHIFVENLNGIQLQIVATQDTVTLQ